MNIYRCSYHKYKNATQNVKNNYYYNNNTYYNSNNNQYRYINNNNNNSSNNYAPKNYWDKRDNFTGNINGKYVQKNQIKNVDPAVFQNNNSNNNRNIKKMSSNNNNDNNNVNDYMSSDNEWNDYDAEMGGSDVECCVLCGDINPEKEHKNNECKSNVGSGKFYKLQKKNVDSFYNVTHGIVSGSKLKTNIHTKLDKIVKSVTGMYYKYIYTYIILYYFYDVFSKRIYMFVYINVL